MEDEFSMNSRAIEKRGAYVKFHYEFSPINISHVELKKDMSEWIIRIVTITGGFFSFAYFLEYVLHASVSQTRKIVNRKRSISKQT